MTFRILLFLTISLLLLPGDGALQAQTELDQVSYAVEVMKGHNFSVLTMGVLASTSVSDADLQLIQQLQVAPPRQMRLLVTRSNFISDVYRDFTFLVREKQVNAILVWPGDLGADESFQKKICQMSQRMKVPVVGLQPGWVENGAILEFDQASGTVHINAKACEVMGYVPAELEGVNLAQH